MFLVRLGICFITPLRKGPSLCAIMKEKIECKVYFCLLLGVFYDKLFGSEVSLVS